MVGINTGIVIFIAGISVGGIKDGGAGQDVATEGLGEGEIMNVYS
ncbi:MAG: hypothetical protein U5L95_05580 [Candidatus Saccharibacteria bacterium]|nr:hypothetical protein [Candidatus Saccharibacteria bacterium]